MKNIILILISVILLSCIKPSGSEVARASQHKMENTAVQSVEIPSVSYFQERRTIANWSKRWDRPNIPTYVYLLSFGKILGYYVADGKPASTRSYLFPEERVTADGAVIGTPDIDGTYGDNNAGIRFFTAEGVAVEWAGDGASYLYSDAPIDFGYDVPRLRVKK